MRALLLSITTLLILATAPAEARHYRNHAASYAVDPNCNITMPCEGVTLSPRGVRVARVVGFGAARPVYTPAPDRRGRTARYTDTPRAEATRFASAASGASAQMLPHPAGCPRSLFCGCGAAVEVFGTPRRDLWLAAAWGKFPRSAPAPGMAAYRSGHVFVLKQEVAPGQWLVADYNSGGHQSRLHVRSLRGYNVVNPRA